jgi:hypothetical protein
VLWGTVISHSKQDHSSSRDSDEGGDYRGRLSRAMLEGRLLNLGRMILRYADAGGRPMSNSEFCHGHARVRVPRDQAAGLKVYDDREVRASTGE